jgi:2-methylcitrate dehydratase PrpD
MTLSRRIARFAAHLNAEALPDAVREKAKVTLLHNLAVALAGGPLWGPAGRWARAEPELAGGARLLLDGRRVAPDVAAFANGALMHARAQDDVFFPGLTHVGAMMTPAALALGEQLDADGGALLVALVAGTEASAAIGDGLAPRTTVRGFRASGLYGVFASTVAAGRLLGLGEDAMANAIGIAASLACGTNQTWIAGTQEYQFQIGAAARNGLLAARLAQAGGTGAPDALEGRAGFFAAFMGTTDGIDHVGEELGTRWRTLDVTYKPYAVCAILQAPVREAIALAQRHDLRADAIRAVRLSLTPAEAGYPGTDSTGPFADVAATLMSAPFCIALALSQRGVRGTDLLRVDDPALMPLVARHRVIADPSLGPRSFVLEVDHADGRTLRHVETTVGEPFNWTRDETLANLRAMRDELPLDAAGVDALANWVLAAERYRVTDLIRVCVVGEPVRAS